MSITAFDVASRFIGVKEIAGTSSNPLILSMLRLDNKWPEGDEVAWCSAFLNFVCWLLRLPRSKSLAARSWLQVGKSVPLHVAMIGSDVVVLKRGAGEQPGPDVIAAPGHVGFYAGVSEDGKFVNLLGGNQGDSVSVASFPMDRVLGVRRLT
jgi:uncharacterized protein (TIGR02594 family)